MYNKGRKKRDWYDILSLTAELSVAFAAIIGLIFTLPNKVKQSTDRMIEEISGLNQRIEMTIRDLEGTMIATANKTRVPDLVGKTLNEAKPKIVEAGLDTIKLRITPVSLSEADTILRQSRPNVERIFLTDSIAAYFVKDKMDTLILRSGVVADQKPEPGAILNLKSAFGGIKVIN